MRNREGGEPRVLAAERQAVVDHVVELAALTPGRTGNLSVRREDRYAITPTGIPYEEIGFSDVPVMTLTGTRVAGEVEPSSETAMHSGIYRALDVDAVAHTHSPWATTLAVLGEPLPPVHYMIAKGGTKIPVAEYATYGSGKLAMNVVEAMMDVDAEACLIANHGLVATGADAADAIETIRAIESTARLYCQARMIGEPNVLPEPEIKNVQAKFKRYGQSDPAEPDE
jgi:L-fuculose-phosphate aldolase